MTTFLDIIVFIAVIWVLWTAIRLALGFAIYALALIVYGVVALRARWRKAVP